jgi:hypothetical protein
VTDVRGEQREGQRTLKAGQRVESPPAKKFKVGTPEWREAFKKRKLEQLGIYQE